MISVKPIVKACLLGVPFLLLILAFKLGTNLQNTTKVKGKIISETFENKRGQKIERFQELYFRQGKQKFFIRHCQSMNMNILRACVNQDVEAEVVYGNGFWDMCDDSVMVQSRTGPYVEIKSIHLMEAAQYQVSDGSNNSYDLTQHQLKYTAVKMENSSSGNYSGGSDKTTTIDLLVFFELQKRMDEAMLNKAEHQSNRAMGTTVITRTRKGKKETVILKQGVIADKILQELKTALQGH